MLIDFRLGRVAARSTTPLKEIGHAEAGGDMAPLLKPAEYDLDVVAAPAVAVIGMIVLTNPVLRSGLSRSGGFAPPKRELG